MLDALRFSITSPTDNPTEIHRSTACAALSVSRLYHRMFTGCAPVFQPVTVLSIRRAQMQTEIKAENVTVGCVALHRDKSFYIQGARDTRKPQLKLPPGLVRLWNTFRPLKLISAVC